MENYIGGAALDRYLCRLRSAELIQDPCGQPLTQQLGLSYTLIVVALGEVELLLEQQTIGLDSHSVFVGLPGQTYGSLTSGPDLEMYIFHFDMYEPHEGDKDGEETLVTVRDAHLFAAPGKVPIHPSRGLAGISREVYRKWKDARRCVSFRCQIDFQEMLYRVYHNDLLSAGLPASGVEMAKQYMEEHYTEPLLVGQLAQVAKLSPKYFADVFKKKYGKSAMEYITELRLQEARRLMARSGTKLRDIAHQVGYSDEFYFSRKFKQETGVAPTVYMNRRRRKLVAYRSELIGQLAALELMPHAAPLHPKWTESYYRNYRNYIPVHLSAYRYNQEWLDNIARLRQVSADLIIATDELEQAERQALEDIAPVFYVNQSQDDWRMQLRALADVLGESRQAERWLKDFGQLVLEAKGQLDAALRGQSLLTLRMIGNQLYIYCNNGMASLLYQDLELQSAWLCDSSTYDIPVTLEAVMTLDPDYILILVRQDSETIRHWTLLKNNPLWLSITAVHRRRIQEISSDPWREYSAHAQFRKLKQVCELLSADCPSQIRISSMDEPVFPLYT